MNDRALRQIVDQPRGRDVNVGGGARPAVRGHQAPVFGGAVAGGLGLQAEASPGQPAVDGVEQPQPPGRRLLGVGLQGSADGVGDRGEWRYDHGAFARLRRSRSRLLFRCA